MLIKRKEKLGSLAISQIILLILGTIAFAYIIGSEIGVVSGQQIGGEFTYIGKKYTIEGSSYIKREDGEQYRKDNESPCSTKWFWDINKNGKWDDTEQTEYDKRVEGEDGLPVCMLSAFVDAMQGAKIPESEKEEKKEEDQGEAEDSTTNLPTGAEIAAIAMAQKDKGKKAKEEREKIGKGISDALLGIITDAGVAAGVYFGARSLSSWFAPEQRGIWDPEAFNLASAVAAFTLKRLSRIFSDEGKGLIFNQEKLQNFFTFGGKINKGLATVGWTASIFLTRRPKNSNF